MRLTTAPACLPSFLAGVTGANYISPTTLPNLSSAVWKMQFHWLHHRGQNRLVLSGARAKRRPIWHAGGLRRIGLMKYIYDRLQTCIVPRCCVLSGRLHPHVSAAPQSETVQGQIVRERRARNAEGRLAANGGAVTHISPAACFNFEAATCATAMKHFLFFSFSPLFFLMDKRLKSLKR